MPADTEGVQEDLPTAVNAWGFVLLGASLAIVCLTWLYFALRKRLSARGKMDSVVAGQLRLAASRGLVADLEVLSTLPGFQVDADLKGWTALHAAAVQGQPGGAGGRAGSGTPGRARAGWELHVCLRLRCLPAAPTGAH
jgi:hypothetical protein